ncbi:MAG: hypothetical protein HQL14_08060 [Candidatus Omnitrophica bacterium]|nr:hypothetical protein [Candidatus Omnitrophota bacterium]
MFKKFCIGILTVCFGLLSVHTGFAADMAAVPPIIVNAYNLQALNQQTLQRDRQNRDEEIAIKGLIEKNNELISTTLSRQQAEGLQKVNQIMLSYRDALLIRDRERIAANSLRPSRYDDLIALTQDVEMMKGIHHDLESRSNVIEEKYKILNDLKEEMMALNEKLKGPGSPQEALDQKDGVIEGFKKIVQQEQDKIQMLVGKLGVMDQKIAQLDEILAQKDQQIAQLKDNLARAQRDAASQAQLIKTQAVQMADLSQQLKDQNIPPADRMSLSNQIQRQADELKDKDEAIRWLKVVLAATKTKAAYSKLSSEPDQLALPQLQVEVREIKDEFALRSKDFNQYENSIIFLKDQVGQLGKQLTQKQQQVDLLKEELENKISEMKTNETKPAVVPTDDRLGLAQELVDLQQQAAALLVEKSSLALRQYNLFDGRLARFEKRVKTWLADDRTQTLDWQDRLEELKEELNQKKHEASALKGQLEEKIAQQKNQQRLEEQIQDLETKLQDSKDQVGKLKAQIQDALGAEAQTQSLKEQLAAQQDKVASLKEELKNKIADSDKMTSMMEDYQKKLESKDNAFNEQMQQALTYKQYKTDMEQQISDLNVELRGKDLSLSMVEQKMEEKIKEMKAIRTELALDRQRLAGIPNSDEIDFLKSGFQKATTQLKQREEDLARIKADADQSRKEIADQNKELQRLKDQLQSTRAEQVPSSKKYQHKAALLEDQLKIANKKIKDLQAQVNQFESESKSDAVRVKLKQALDKIDEQGKLIDLLSQKLEQARG